MILIQVSDMILLILMTWMMRVVMIRFATIIFWNVWEGTIRRRRRRRRTIQHKKKAFIQQHNDLYGVGDPKTTRKQRRRGTIAFIEVIDRMTRYRSKKVLTVAFMLGCCSFMMHSITTSSYDPFVVGSLTIEESSIQHTTTTAEYIQDEKVSLADDLSNQIMVNIIDRLNCVIESILNTGATAVDTIDELRHNTNVFRYGLTAPDRDLIFSFFHSIGLTASMDSGIYITLEDETSFNKFDNKFYYREPGNSGYDISNLTSNMQPDHPYYKYNLACLNISTGEPIRYVIQPMSEGTMNGNMIDD
jgi:hypothetical protein